MQKRHSFLVFSLFFLFPVLAFAQSWSNLEIPEAKPIEKNILARMIDSDMPGLSARVLAHPTILRVEVTGGNGIQKISETVFLFKNIPAVAWLKSDSDLKGSREAVTFSPFKSCTWDEANHVHECKGAGVANAGPVDVLNILMQKHVLLVSRAKTAGRAKTILWLAYDSAASIYYLPYADMGFEKLGKDTVQVTSYVPTAANVPILPPDPMDAVPAPGVDAQPQPPAAGTQPPAAGTQPPAAGTQPPAAGTQPPAAGTQPPAAGTQPPAAGTQPPVDAQPPAGKPALPPVETSAQWKGYTVLTPRTGKQLMDVWRTDRLAKLQGDPQLLQYHWVRIQVKGVDLNPAKSLRLALPAAPAMAYVFAWTDKQQEKRFYLGDLVQCQKRQGKGCPIQVDGKNWYDLTGLITTTRFVAQAVPDTPGNSNMILWLAFSFPVQEIGYIHAKNGTISAVAWAKTGTETETPLAAAPAVEGLPQDGPMQLKLVPKTVAYAAASSYLRRLGLVPQDSGLLGYPYLVRIHVKPSSTQNQALEIRFPVAPAVVLGQSASLLGNTQSYSMVQMGKPSACRIRDKQMHCPMHFHGLGWRDLSGGFHQGKTRLILTAAAKSDVREVILLLAFEQKPDFVQVQEYPNEETPAAITTDLYRIQQFR